ncbi:MAG: CPBP family intramembrane glutamic endopeptidase [Jatrophihabitantaceae bacterium]
MTAPEDASTVAPAPAERKSHYGLEALAVLGVSLGMSAIYALLSFIRTQVTITGGFANAQVPVVTQQATVYPWLDLLDALANVLNGVLPAFLAIVLLLRTPGGPGLGIGLDRVRLREIAQGAGFCALIGIPGLGLIWLGRQLGFNGQIIAVSFPDVWYRIPVLLLDAAQNGIVEEVVVTAFLLTRLRQLGWSNQRALGAAALLRGGYHLYQGYGGFAGNLVMGLIFGYWFQRTRRVVPLVIAHFLLDAISFVGYLYLAPHISWL